MAIITQGLSHQSFAGSKVCCASNFIRETLHVEVWINWAKFGNTDLQRSDPVKDGRLVELVPKVCWLHVTFGNGEGFVRALDQFFSKTHRMRRFHPIDLMCS